MCFQNDMTRNLDDCIFVHSLVASRYDVYRVKTYPNATSRCRAESRQGGRGNQSSLAAASTICSRPWYLGVTKHGKVKVVKLKNASQTPTWRTYFIQEWIHKSVYGQANTVGLDLSKIPLSSTASPVKNTELAMSKNLRTGATPKKTAPVFALLNRRKTNNGQDNEPAREMINKRDRAATASETVDCSNLLRSDCSRRSLPKQRNQQNRVINAFLLGSTTSKKHDKLDAVKRSKSEQLTESGRTNG